MTNAPITSEIKDERRKAIGFALIVMGLTLLPYLYGLFIQGARPGLGWFSGYTFNATDHCVYLSWMRQGADGGFFQRNLFTTEPQTGHQFNIFFLAMGWISALVHLSPLLIYQIARLALGIALLRTIWWLLEMLIPEAHSRCIAYRVVALSAGLGWLPGLWEKGFSGPTDIWQPELVTFLSIYLFPLFSVSLLLMVGMIGWLWRANKRKCFGDASKAGLCGLLLGNIHTYDVITVGAVWIGWLIFLTVKNRNFNYGDWLRALTAGALTFVSTGYMIWLIKTESVFAARAAVPTLSSPIWQYSLGFGLPLVLAIAGALHTKRQSYSNASSQDAKRFLWVWFLTNVAVAYLPVAFQRKMVMGAHIPVAILGGITLEWLLFARHREQSSGGNIGISARLTVGVLLLIMGMTNWRFVLRDISKLPENREYVRSYLYEGEIKALDWIRLNAKKGEAVQPLPWVAQGPNGVPGFFDNSMACFTPGLTGHPVNAGHWGETPEFGKTMNRWVRFLRPETADEFRRSLVRETGVKYIIFSQKHNETNDDMAETHLLSLFRQSPPGWLHKIDDASNTDADVYVVE